MVDDKLQHGWYEPRVSAGDYAAQAKLDFRLARGETLKMISPLSRRSLQSVEEHESRLAMNRRHEAEGASLIELGKKYGL